MLRLPRRGPVRGAQILPLEDGELAECRLYTCQHPACGSTYSADPEPRPDATEADNMRVTDRRAWAALRNARMRGLETMHGVAPPAARSAPGPTSRGVLPTDAGRYRLVGQCDVDDLIRRTEATKP